MTKHKILFKVQTVFSAVTLTFCITMLSVGKDPSLYLPILTSLIGYWLPAPKYQKLVAQDTQDTQGDEGIV